MINATVFIADNCSQVQPILDVYHPSVMCALRSEILNMTALEGFHMFNNSAQFTTLNCTVFAELFNAANHTRFQCLDNDNFIMEINMLILYFGIIAIGVLIGGWIMVTTFQCSSERQIYRMRLAYYKAVLRQNIAWFDDNASGAINSRLSE